MTKAATEMISATMAVYSSALLSPELSAMSGDDECAREIDGERYQGVENNKRFFVPGISFSSKRRPYLYGTGAMNPSRVHSALALEPRVIGSTFAALFSSCLTGYPSRAWLL